jgi:hypothetical protein
VDLGRRESPMSGEQNKGQHNLMVDDGKQAFVIKIR